MVASFLTDEHIPSVFVTTLRSNGYDVFEAKEVFEEGTHDERLLRYSAERDRIFITHDKKDFGGNLGFNVDHAGVVISTEPNFLRDEPDGASRTLERALTQYPPGELQNQVIWLEQWRR